MYPFTMQKILTQYLHSKITKEILKICHDLLSKFMIWGCFPDCHHSLDMPSKASHRAGTNRAWFSGDFSKAFWLSLGAQDYRVLSLGDFIWYVR